MRAGRLRTDDEQAVAEEQAGASAGRDRVDVELRRLDGHAGRSALEHVLEGARVARHVRARAAHVEADHWHVLIPGAPLMRLAGRGARGVVEAGARIAHDAPCGAGQDRTVAEEVFHGREAAIALHEADLDASEPCVKAFGEGREVPPDDWREVGVHAGRAAAGHHAHHGHDL